MRLLSNLLKRRIPIGMLIPPELARALTSVSAEIRRQVGLLVDRRGAITEVLVGDAHSVNIPALKRSRGAGGRLSGLSLLHTHLSGGPLTQDDLTDLIVLRLDLICAIEVHKDGFPGGVQVAYLVPDRAGLKEWDEMNWPSVHAVDLNPDQTIRALEEEFARHKEVLEVDGEGDRAILVGVYGESGVDSRVRMAELKELASTAGLRVADTVQQFRPQIDPRYVLGKGKLNELVIKSKRLGVNLLIFDRNLSPSQARNIAEATDQKCIDRTQLILDIFAQHADTWEGKIQVELAQLRYRLPMLTGKGTALSRLMGGIGGRGPGESQLEVDRRRVKERIAHLEKQVRSLGRSRVQKRSKRKKEGLAVVSIVGYTNAGKSTLLNRLTHSTVPTADKLFATLDPTSRRLRFPRERDLIVTDTVGFIRELPPDLIAAFRSTLEELSEADLLLHVVDLTSEDQEEQMACVNDVLDSLDLEGIPRLLVFNKCDLVGEEEAERACRPHKGVAVSALTGAHLDALVSTIRELLSRRKDLRSPTAT